MVTILSPAVQHIYQIQNLNKRYLLLNQPFDIQIENGFVRIGYSTDEIHEIIRNKDIAIATDKDRVIGYYLIGRNSGNTALNYQLEKARHIFGEPKLVNRVGYGAQAVIEEKYRGHKILKPLLTKLIQLVDKKYDVLFSSISKVNANAFYIHIKGGYKLLDQDETKYYVGLYI